MPHNDSTVNGSATVAIKKVKRSLEELFDAQDEGLGDGQFVKYRKICLETKFSRLSLNDKEN